MNHHRSDEPGGTWSQLGEGIFDLVAGELLELLLAGAFRLAAWAFTALLELVSSF